MLSALRKLDWRAIGLGVVVLALIFTFFAQQFPQAIAVREAVFDEYQRMKPRPYNPESPVRVIDIDEESLRQLGQWPWPRTYLTELVIRLTNAGAAAIAFDMTFSEPDRTSPAVLVPSLSRFEYDYSAVFNDPATISPDAEIPDHDALFGWVNAQAPVILGVIATDDTKPPEFIGPVRGIGISGDSAELDTVLTNFQGAIANLPVLAEGASGIATISLSKTEGDVIRRVPLVVVVGDKRMPTLAIDALRVGQGAQSHILKTTRGSGETDLGGDLQVASIKTGGVVVPLDADGALRVRYSGAVEERVIPAHKVLEPGGLSSEVAKDVEGKIVFVGASAAVLFDVKTTPLTPRISGVHVHAEIVEQIIDGAYLTYPGWAPGLEIVAMVVLGLVVIFMLGANWPVLGFLTMIVAVGASAYGSWHAFSEHSLLLNPAVPMLGIAVPHFVVSGFKFFVAEAGRREVTRQFEHFVSPEVIQDIIEDPESHLTPGGAQRELSIMFLDVRRFSTITEKMEPQEVIAFINKLLTPLTDAIIAEQGTIDKYMGDAVMAFWNAPRETPGHEVKAIRAMLAFNPIMEELNAEFTAMGLPDIGIGVGINTGLCSVGNMGSLKRLAYSCVGDSVNLASRLEGQTKAYGVGNLIGSKTANGAKDFPLIELDSVAVKGRTQPETIYTVAGMPDLSTDETFQQVLLMLTGARAAYLGQMWDAAEDAFREAADMPTVGVFEPRGYCEIMIERIRDYRANPPPEDWDGVYVATSK